MKSKWMSPIRTLLFLGVAGTFGTASAGVLQVGPVSHSPDAAGTSKFAFDVANTGATAVSGLHVYINGQDGSATCASATSNGHTFAIAGELGAGDSVECAGAASGASTSITVLGKGSNGAQLNYTAHEVQLAAAVPAQPLAGILLGAVFNDTNTNQVFDAGETISLSYTIFNFGNTALSSIVVSDDFNPSGAGISCPQTALAVGASMYCTSTHTITAGEANSASISDNANVDGVAPGNQTVNSSDSVIRTGSSQAEIRALKSPLFAQDNDGNKVAGPGDLVAYTFAIKNSGSLVLSPVTMTEADPSRIDSPITCNSTTVGGIPFTGLGTGALAVGDTILCSATYTITTTDVTNGEADNLVNITGQPLVGGVPSGGVASGSAASVLVVPAAPPPPPPAPVTPSPVNDWRALLLLGLGLLGVGVLTTRRKAQKR